MPVILSTSNIIIDNGITNFTMETVKSTTYIEKDTVGTTSNLLAEPFVESVYRMYPPVRTFDGTNIYPVSITSGAFHTVFLTNDGKVYSCGYNLYGELGLNDTSYRSVPTLISALNSLTISAIACAYAHTVFLTNDGKVYSCGRNYSGQLGISTNSGTNTANPTPTLITTIGSLIISAIVCGWEHTVFLTNNGKVYSCGRNYYGELGISTNVGTETANTTPTLITTTTSQGTAFSNLTISAIAAGANHTVFLTNDGKVYSCGSNDYGQLGQSTSTTTPSQITALNSLTISAISCGHLYTIFLTNNGKVYSCGVNDRGQLGLSDTTNRSVPTLITTFNNITISAIYCGGVHTVFLTNDGIVYSCGYNNEGQLGLGHTLGGFSVPIIVPTFSKPRINGSTANLTLGGDHVISVKKGGAHTLYLTASGKVYGNGYNANGELGLGHNIIQAIPTLITTTTVGGTPTAFNNLIITAIATGSNHSLFLTNDGKVYCCGYNQWGQLGLNDASSRNAPTLITTTTVGGTPTAFNNLIITAISCSDGNHSLFLTNNGKVYGCGNNTFGDSGAGGDPYHLYSPTLANTGSLTITAIAAGAGFSLFLTNTGSVLSCGWNNNGQLGLGDALNRTTPTLITTTTVGGTSTAFNNLIITAIAAGYDFSLFLTNDGRVYTCGRNAEGRLGLGDITNRSIPTLITTTTVGGTPTAFNNLIITAIAAGTYSLFLTNNGKVYSCGWNQYGQLGLNDTINSYYAPTLITKNIESAFVNNITAATYHTALITSSGQVYTWGWNEYRNLGLGDGTDRSIPTLIPTFSLNTVYGSGLYTVSYSTFTTSFEPFRCFNEWSSSNNPATWRAGDYTGGVFNSNLNLVSDYNGDWLVIKLPVSIKLKRFDIKQISTALNRAPKNFRLYGSTNGSSWTLLVDKENATYTNLFYTQYPSNTNQYYNHFGLVVSTLLGNTETTLSFDELFIYGAEQVSTPLLLNSTNKSLSIPNSILPSYPNGNLNYNLSFPVPTFVNNISTSSNIILQGDYTISQVSRTSSQLIPNGGQINILNSSTLTLQESSNITLNYHLLNPIVDSKGAQWTYNSANPHVYHLGNVGIGTKTPSYPLHVNGNMFVSSTAFTGSAQTSWAIPSDRRIKENIVKASYEKCLDNVKNIELYRFNFKDNVVNTNDYNQLGFIAQEVQNIYPKAVEVNMIKDKNGVIPDLLSLNTTQIDYTLYGAVKELIKKVEFLEKKLEENENSNMMLSDVSDLPEESSSNIIELPIYPDDYLIMMLPPHLRVEHMMLNESSSNIAPRPVSHEEYLRNLMMIPLHLHKTYEEYLKKLKIYPDGHVVPEVHNESTSNIQEVPQVPQVPQVPEVTVVPEVHNESTSNIQVVQEVTVVPAVPDESV